MNGGDFAKYKGKSPEQGLDSDKKLLVYLTSATGEWVFTAVPDSKMGAGILGVSTLQRRTAQLELGQRIEVRPFQPEPRMALSSAEIKFQFRYSAT